MPAGYVGNNLDCDDGDPDVHPGTAEIGCDGIDQDCDGYDANGIIGPPCPLQMGVCAGSTMPCINGAWGPCGEEEFGSTYEDPETTCDSRDNDCDGMTDETPDCNDNVPCTNDICVNGACCNELLPGMCVINGICYAQYVKNPSNDCQECQPWVNIYNWTDVADGTPCADGACAQGTCLPVEGR